MLEKHVTLNHIRVYPDGHIEAQFSRGISENGKWAQEPIPHHVSIVPNIHTDLDAYFTSINANFADEGYPPIAQVDIDAVKAQAGITITPAIVVAWQKQAAALQGSSVTPPVGNLATA